MSSCILNVSTHNGEKDEYISSVAGLLHPLSNQAYRFTWIRTQAQHVISKGLDLQLSLALMLSR